MFGSACKSVLNMLRALNLSDGHTVVKGHEWTKAVAIVVAVVKSRVSDAAKIVNMVMTGAGEG